MILEIPEKVEQILRALTDHGYEAYAVGGCVRDSILGRNPYDWDITTSALPLQVKEIFPRTIDTGLQHGTVTVMMAHEGFEVTTYRVDGEYEDGRHPKDVTFTASLEEDLKRRDFTINAMAYHPESGLVDLFHGMDDLKNKVIRCVGDPVERFTEDALRIMRAVRFSAQLGFTIDPGTYRALSVLAPNLKQISAERIRTELEKILVSPHPDYLKLAYETGMTEIFFPEWNLCMQTEQNNPHHSYTVGEHTIQSMIFCRPEKTLRLTMLLHDIGKPFVKTTDEKGTDHFRMHGPTGEKLAEKILKRWKYDNDTIYAVSKLVRWHDSRPEANPYSVRKLMSKIGEELFPYYLEVRVADTMAQSEYQREEKLLLLQQIRKCYEEILEQHQCISLKTLAVNGKDLIACGYPKGKEIGALLALLLDYVLEHPEENEKAHLLEILPKLKSDTEN